MAVLVKTDIFKKVMYYAYQKGAERGQLYPLTIDQVRELMLKKQAGEPIESLQGLVTYTDPSAEPQAEQFGYEDVRGAVELPAEQRRKKKRRNKNSKNSSGPKKGTNRAEGSNSAAASSDGSPAAPKNTPSGGTGKKRGRGRNRGRNRNRDKGGDKKSE
jgi:hypothetical protein